VTVATAAAKGTTASRDAAMLAQVDFGRRATNTRPGSGSDEAHDYAMLLARFARDMAEQVEGTAAYIKAAIRRTAQGHALDVAQAGWTAGRSTRNLFASAASLDAASRQARAFWRDYENMYASLMNPKGKQWDFRSKDGHGN
jgi:hypothetical protein